MDVRIGITSEGHAAGLATAIPRPLLLVGDVGRGMTTTARYSARWWLVKTVRHAHLDCPTGTVLGGPDAPGQMDFRCRRWQAPAAWSGVAR